MSNAHPVSLPNPFVTPSYRCAREADILDARFVRKVDKMVFAQGDGVVRPQIIGGGPDAYMAHADVQNLKGVGKGIGRVLKSRMFGIQTIGQLANYRGDFGNQIARLPRAQVEVLNALRTALQTCLAHPPAVNGRKVTAHTNDPNMAVHVVPGKDVVKHNQGREGAAEIVIDGDPTNNGFVRSTLNVHLDGYTAHGRGPDSELRFDPIDVSVPADTSTRVTADRLVAALEAKGLSAGAEPLPEIQIVGQRHPVRISVWSDLVLD